MKKETDFDKLKKILEDAGIPHECEADKQYQDITIIADASDKYVTISFEKGKFSYSN